MNPNNMHQPSHFHGGGGDPNFMTFKDWFITLAILSLVPCGFIMAFVWAFGSDPNETRRIFSKAYLVVMGISMVLGMVIGVLYMVALMAAATSF
ncbi:MAG: hypothetical protein FWC89_03195 [Defluviitaleaceae bacterium]|nr:hypothetical protein [Defluviitaleaceae bacterium]